MADEIGYMTGIVAVGFALNFGLRALPFLLLGGRGRRLPAWITRVGSFVSPVIIAGLIVYAYSGSAWRTPWPYLAGILTVALHLWKRNPLVSIVAGTALYMLLVNCCGCASQRMVELDAENPSIRVSTLGVRFGDDFVKPQEVPDILADCDIPRERVIHILLDEDVKDLREARFLMVCLSRAGYTRPVLVTKRHGESVNRGKSKKASSAAEAPRTTGKTEKKRKIRYKRASE